MIHNHLGFFVGSQIQEVSRANILHQTLIIRSRFQAFRQRIRATHLPPGRRRAPLLLLLAHRPININHPLVLQDKTNGSRLLALPLRHSDKMGILDNRDPVPSTRTMAVTQVQT